MKFNKLLLTAVIIFSTSSPALAIIDAQLLLGQRFSSFESSGSSDSVTAFETTLSGHISPIPIFGFGLFFTNHDFDTSSSDDVLSFSEFKGYQLGAEVTADFPIDLFDLGLYGKAGYAFYGAYSGKGTTTAFADPETGDTSASAVDGEYSTTGYKLAAGLKWTPIAIVSALFEINYGASQWKQEELKVGGSKVSGSNDFDESFTTVLVGAEVSI